MMAPDQADNHERTAVASSQAGGMIGSPAAFDSSAASAATQAPTRPARLAFHLNEGSRVILLCHLLTLIRMVLSIIIEEAGVRLNGCMTLPHSYSFTRRPAGPPPPRPRMRRRPPSNVKSLSRAPAYILYGESQNHYGKTQGGA
jgi:hypothetical protein